MTAIEITATRKTYAGLFMTTLASLIYEILLTRIFSVTMWYHFAFLAISIAMFGMTLGALVVYLFPRFFSLESTKYRLAASSLLFAVTIVASLLIFLQIPFDTAVSLKGLLLLALRFAVITIPFVFSGICVSLALTRFPHQVSKLYFTDLVGAAIGCLLVILMLNIMDGPTAVMAVSFLLCLGSLFYALEIPVSFIRRTACILAGLLFLFVLLNVYLCQQNTPLMRLRWIKGTDTTRYQQAIYEKWNSYSRITVSGDPKTYKIPECWGLSPKYRPPPRIRQLMLKIDAAAATPITAFDGDRGKLSYLKYDITNMAQYLCPDANVLVIGSGGGRDILSALAFQQKSVLAVEINGDILSCVNGRFGDFSGHLDRIPNVTFVNEEARSYIVRSHARYDIIQASLIDTWAATAAGAFILSENSLYTEEAWKVFLDHLTHRGALTFSRWYFRDRPGEVYRLVSLASTALMRSGVKEPRRNILVLRHLIRKRTGFNPEGVGTIIVGKEPFDETDLSRIEGIARKMGFEIALSPTFALDPTFAQLGSGENLKELFASFPINIAPPTDDSPYFFQMLRLRDAFNPKLMHQGYNSFNIKAVFILGAILLTMIVLTLLCIVIPFLLTMKREKLKGSAPLFVYFGAIGFGFMLVEVSQMQRLIIFLGHPTFSLSVVLFSLLLSSGLGSYLTQKIDKSTLKNAARMRLLLLLGVLFIFGMLTPLVNARFVSFSEFWDVTLAIAILSTLGLFMGMAFPIGIKMASVGHMSLTPWLWGINGAASVCAPILATAIALSAGISTSYWTGFVCYGIAFLSFIWKDRLAKVQATGSA